MEAVYHILHYLKSSSGKGLLFSQHDHLKIEAYTDADWAGSIMDRQSTSGYCTFVGGNLATWRSKKQSMVARSSADCIMTIKWQSVLLIIQSNMIEPNMLKLIDTLLKKNSENVSSAHHM
jgi:hypothetical protein